MWSSAYYRGREPLLWMGVIILGTRFELGSRRDLWKTNSDLEFIPPPNFGVTGMSRNRFEDLWREVRRSSHPESRPAGM